MSYIEDSEYEAIEEYQFPDPLDFAPLSKFLSHEVYVPFSMAPVGFMRTSVGQRRCPGTIGMSRKLVRLIRI